MIFSSGWISKPKLQYQNILETKFNGYTEMFVPHTTSPSRASPRSPGPAPGAGTSLLMVLPLEFLLSIDLSLSIDLYLSILRGIIYLRLTWLRLLYTFLSWKVHYNFIINYYERYYTKQYNLKRTGALLKAQPRFFVRVPYSWSVSLWCLIPTK